jgi:hypothetical protein
VAIVFVLLVRLHAITVCAFFWLTLCTHIAHYIHTADTLHTAHDKHTHSTRCTQSMSIFVHTVRNAHALYTAHAIRTHPTRCTHCTHSTLLHTLLHTLYTACCCACLSVHHYFPTRSGHRFCFACSPPCHYCVCFLLAYLMYTHCTLYTHCAHTTHCTR